MASQEVISPEEKFFWQARLVCRPVLPADTPGVLALTHLIWEGGDYIPSVWEAWLKDAKGLLAVAHLGSRLVGLIKLTEQAADEYWLEGLRVHPEFQRQGIASHLHDYIMAYWENNCGGVIRLITASTRFAVHRLCQKTGFKQLAEIYFLEATPIYEPQNSFTQVTFLELEQVMEKASSNPLYLPEVHLIDVGWQFASPSEEVLSKAIQEGKAWWWRGRCGFLVADQDVEDTEKSFFVKYLSCPKEELVLFLGDCRRMAAQGDYKKLIWNCIWQTWLAEPIAAAGVERKIYEGAPSLFLFEKWAASGILNHPMR